MSLVVQKLSASCLAHSQRTLDPARKAIRASQEGDKVIVVVSLLRRAQELMRELANEMTVKQPKKR